MELFESCACRLSPVLCRSNTAPHRLPGRGLLTIYLHFTYTSIILLFYHFLGWFSCVRASFFRNIVEDSDLSRLIINIFIFFLKDEKDRLFEWKWTVFFSKCGKSLDDKYQILTVTLFFFGSIRCNIVMGFLKLLVECSLYKSQCFKWFSCYILLMCVAKVSFVSRNSLKKSLENHCSIVWKWGVRGLIRW